MSVAEVISAPSTLTRIKTPDPDGYNIVGAAKLFTPLPPVDWLCQTLRIAPGAPTLFAGYGYSGKSVALQSLALSVASGTALWGSKAVKRGRVLHLDYEQGLRITARRYQRLAYAEGIDSRSLDGSLECGILPSSRLSLDALCWMGDGRAAVVVDSWRAAHPGVDENSSEVRVTLDVMGSASEKTGCTFLTLHHARKNPPDSKGDGKFSIRGSSGFFDGSQTVYIFDGEEIGAPVVIQIKDRIEGEKMDPFVLRIEDRDAKEGLSVRSSSIEVRAKDSFEEQAAKVLAHLFQHPQGVAGIELLAERVGIGEKRTGALVSSLESGRSVVRVRPKGARGNACVIFHPDHVPVETPS